MVKIVYWQQHWAEFLVEMCPIHPCFYSRFWGTCKQYCYWSIDELDWSLYASVTFLSTWKMLIIQLLPLIWSSCHGLITKLQVIKICSCKVFATVVGAWSEIVQYSLQKIDRWLQEYTRFLALSRFGGPAISTDQSFSGPSGTAYLSCLTPKAWLVDTQSMTWCSLVLLHTFDASTVYMRL